MSEFQDLKEYIAKNYSEVTLILEEELLKIVNASELKLLHGKFLTDFWERKLEKRIIFAIYFDETIIQKFQFEELESNLNNKITEVLKTDNFIKVDEAFNIVDSKHQRFEIEDLINLSSRNIVVFVFGEEGIDLCVRGKHIYKINIFYDESNKAKYKKLYHISNIQACLKEYERYINEPGINQAFFASNTSVLRINPNPPKNILRNKPEVVLRDNLYSFLNKNTQHFFTKETELNNKRELDLYTEDEGKKYLIEIKWLGQCINDMETKLCNPLTDYAARDGVKQTLEYIKQLFEVENYIVQCGYLCVFDARDNKKEINYKNFDFIDDDLKPYYKNHFIKLDEIKLERI